jgi:hypothetical protein
MMLYRQEPGKSMMPYVAGDLHDVLLPGLQFLLGIVTNLYVSCEHRYARLQRLTEILSGLISLSGKNGDDLGMSKLLA